MFYEKVLDPILKHICEQPQEEAFYIAGECFTYAQLGRRICAIRGAIQAIPHANPMTGLVINDDLDTYASIIALWLEGDCYVPLHPGWPLDRCEDILAQTEADLVLDSSKSSRYNHAGVLLTSGLGYFPGDSLEPKAGVDEDALAYILFTSGSTGKPKGVQMTRGNLGAFMDSFWKTGVDIRQGDNCLQAFDLSFDVSIQSFLAALTRGACVCTIPHGQIKFLYAAQLIEERHIAFGAMAPSMLRYLQPYFPQLDATSIRACILTAEACPLSLALEWKKCAVNTEIYDFYGPTEATVYCTYYKLRLDGHDKTLNGIVSIGQPMANVTAIILGENGEELAAGEKGELCVAGPQVTAGYLKNPEKNAEAFFTHNLDGVPTRFYHTGDLCYRDEDGDIMYSGRLDHQAKIQGFRVELGEIEFHAREFLKGTDAVCMAFDNKDSLTEIAMFIEKKEFDTSALLAYMRTKMPGYMIPTRILFVPTFPLNGNGKTDKPALRKMLTV